MLKLIMAIPAFLLARFFEPRPLIVIWQITGNCQSKCQYCDFWQEKNKPELPLPLIKQTLDELAKNGTKILQLTGGEPLLRNDIEQILAYADSKGFYISLNSNGLLVPAKIDLINKHVDLVKLSLDGSEKTHNNIRGIECYKQVISALELLKKNNKKFMLSTVISKKNINNLTEVLELAKHYNCQASFQVAFDHKLFSNKNNAIGFTSAEKKAVVEKLLALKRSALGKYMNNTKAAIKQIIGSAKRNCYILKIGTKINYEGRLKPCLYKNPESKIDTKISEHNSFTNIYKQLKFNISCQAPCFCATRLNINLLFSFDPETIFDLFFKRTF